MYSRSNSQSSENNSRNAKSHSRNGVSRLVQPENHNSRSNSRSDSRNCCEPTRKIFICPCILGAFFKSWGGPCASESQTSVDGALRSRAGGVFPIESSSNLPLLMLRCPYLILNGCSIHDLVLFKAQLKFRHLSAGFLFSIFFFFFKRRFGLKCRFCPLKCQFWALKCPFCRKRWEKKEDRSKSLGKPLRAVP